MVSTALIFDQSHFAAIEAGCLAGGGTQRLCSLPLLNIGVVVFIEEALQIDLIDSFEFVVWAVESGLDVGIDTFECRRDFWFEFR